MDPNLSQKRLYVVSGFVVFAVVIFIAKLFYLQIIHGHAYEMLADRQYVTNTSNLFDRGSIYFTSKDDNQVSAATLKSGFKIAVSTITMGDPETLYRKIGKILGLEHDAFIAATYKKDPYVEIATNVPEDQASQITAMKLSGVSVYRMNWRFYPAGDLAAHVIGFMGFKGDDFAGRYGIERSYDQILARTDQKLYVNFFAEIFTDISKLVKSNEEVEGDVVTTIEPSVQKTLEQMLDGVKEKWNSDRVGGIVMDPKTGAILAMGLDNGFDLNETRKVSDVSKFNNPLVESDFEMGSIMKPVVMAIALDQKAVTPTTTYNDVGFVKVGNKTIYNFDKKGRGNNVTMQTVLNQSLNTGMVFVMQHMDKAAFKNQWTSFGFGQKTGIDLPAETSGLISNLNTNRDVEFANVSFGQGVAVSPIEVIRAQSVLANGGHLVTPHLVSEIDYPSGFSKKPDWPVTGQLIKPETSATITKMLTTVFDNYDEGKIKLDHYSIAAKTGTAQIANHATGGYYTDRNLHTFMAYFPAQNPKFIVFLYNYYPKNGAKFSSDTLLPPFVDFAKFLINYYDVPPDR